MDKIFGKAPSGINRTSSPRRKEEHPCAESHGEDGERRPMDKKRVSEAKTGDSPSVHGDLTIEEELFQVAENRIFLLNMEGAACGQADKNEAERQHIPNLVNMEEYEDWAKEAKPFAVSGNFKRQDNKFVGEKIDMNEILKDVTTLDGRVKKCRHVMVLGSAGTGKTTLLRRISLLGEHGLLKGKLPITLDLRGFAIEENLTPSSALLGNLFSDWDSERMKQRYNWIKENSEKVAFFLDSLDTLPFEFQKERQRIGYDTPATIDVILHNLLTGDLFPKSVIISSSREYKVRNLHPSVRPDRCVLLDGLKKNSVEHLIDGFLGKDRGEEVKNHINLECPDLWPLLSIPIFAVFTSIGFQQDGFRPKTMSGILIKFFWALIDSPHVHVKDILEVLKRLMPMSYAGLCKESVFFTRDDLERFGLTPGQVIDLGVLIPQSQGTYFASKLMQDDRFFLYFNHQTEQECLAALHVLSMNGENFTAFVKRNLYETKFTVVRRFICGILLNREVLEATTKLTEISAVDEKRNTLLKSLENVLEERQKSSTKEMFLELFIDLNEAREGVADLCRSWVREIDFSNVSLSPSDVQAITSVMKYCQHLECVNLCNTNFNVEKMEILARRILQSNVKVKRLDITQNRNIGSEGLFHVGRLVDDWNVDELNAELCNLMAEHLEKFAEGAGNAIVGKLNISGNSKLGPKGMFILGKLVKNHEVKCLIARACRLNFECLKKLMEGLEEVTLEKLNVSYNAGLGLKGMFFLGKLVKNHEVKDVDAGSCNLSSECVQQLTEGLEDAKVRELDLGEISRQPHYTRALLNLLPHVEKEFDLTEWQISDIQRQELQDKLNEIRSPFLKIGLGTLANTIYLKAVAFGESYIMKEIEELAQRIKENLTRPFSTARVIGKNGGTIVLQECELAFHDNAFDEDATASLIVRSEEDAEQVDEGKAISPVVKCSTSQVKFRGLATIKLPIHYQLDGNSIAVLCKKNTQSQWKEIDVHPLVLNNSVTFQVDHFCWYKIIKKISNIFWPTPILLHNFIYFNKDTSSICVLTCIRDCAVEEKCIRSLEEKGFRQSAMPLPDNIELARDEQMSYRVMCQHPLPTMINPDEDVRYTGATFSRRSEESRILSLEPAPETTMVRVQYTLNRPEEQPKTSVLSMKWKENLQEHHPVIADATAFTNRLEVIGSTENAYNAHLHDETIYHIDPRRRKGTVLIINNNFQGTANFREGSDVDMGNMMTLWTALGFSIVTRMNLTGQQMLDSCQRFAAESIDISVVVVIIMSHGGKGPNGKEVFLGKDGEKLKIEDVIATFTTNGSPHLRGIPKLFLFQACRGGAEDFDRNDIDAHGVDERYFPQRADMLITFPTQTGYVAIRNTVDGSWLMNAVTNVFMQHAHDTHVLDMLTMVNDEVTKRITTDRGIQISNQENYLRKKLFLFPGWPMR